MRHGFGEKIKVKKMSSNEKAYNFFLVIFITMIVLTNIIGVKLFDIKSITLTTGLITYPLTFLITDIVCEDFGKSKSSLMV